MGPTPHHGRGPRDRPPGRGGAPGETGRAVSGRRFVTAAILGLLAGWGSLYLVFARWREGVRARIALGEERVLPVLDPLGEVEPPGVPADEWAEAVRLTRVMVGEVIGTGRLDRRGLEAMREDLAARVAEARRSPDRAVAVLAGIWARMGRLTRLREELERPRLIRDEQAPDDAD